jgi:radical SAM protein with 4Fe4S-binding SPASM domain
MSTNLDQLDSREVPLSDVVDSNPTHIWIEPTNRCNTRCKHCHHYDAKFGEDMSFDLFATLRDNVLDTVKYVQLVGYGEPFMAKHYWEMFDELSGRGIEIMSISNGILLRDDERVAKMVRQKMTLTLSIDGARAETFEFVRPFIKWPKMIETLECLKRNVDAVGPACPFKMRMNFVAMKHSIGDLPDLVRLAAKYGIGEIVVAPLGQEEQFENVNGQSLHDSPELVSPAYLAAIPLALDLGVRLHIPESYREMIFAGAERRRGLRGLVAYARRYLSVGASYIKRRGLARAAKKLEKPKSDLPVSKVGGNTCTMPWHDAYFGSNGAVYPCCMMSEPMGNLKTQSWQEIWNGANYQNLRRTTHSWNPTEVCRVCHLYTGINGGDDKAYPKFFAKFAAEPISFSDSSIAFGEGFHAQEHSPEFPDYRWLAREGTFTIDLDRPAKFLRLRLVARAPVPQLNFGKCTINGAEPEPFDNSMDVVHFPISHVGKGRMVVKISMEFGHHIGDDPRELALGVCGVEVLR